MSSLLALGAERGITFERSFATTPLCCPSRATILTGLYARNHGVLKNDPPQGGVEAFDDRSTLATWLQGVGVRTGLVGRYLNGYEQEGIPPGWRSWFALWQFSERNSDYFDFRVSDQGERRYFDSKPESYSTRVLGEEARQFVAAEPAVPFLLYLAPRTPHSPATPDRLDAGMFKDRELPLPPSYDEEDVADKPAWVRENGRLRTPSSETASRRTFRPCARRRPGRSPRTSRSKRASLRIGPAPSRPASRRRAAVAQTPCRPGR